MSDSWKLTRLGDLVAIKHGWPFKSGLFSEERVGRPIVVNVGNFNYSGGFRFDSTAVKEYLGEYPGEYNLRAHDILLVMTCQTQGGEILGIPASVPDDGKRYLHNQRLGKVVLKTSGVSDRYLYWLFLTPSFNRELVNTASGTKILHTAPSRIEAFEFRLPPLREQVAIASVLDTVENKIELNRKMSATLEAIARALFKSWFVDFDPVRAKAEGRDPGLPAEIAAMFPDSFDRAGSTNIPNRWTVATVGDVFVATMGQSPPGYTYNQEEEGVPFYQGRADFGFRFPKRRVYCKAPTRYANAGDTLLSVRAPVGDINLAIENCSIGRGVAALRHNSGSSSYTYYATWFLKEALEAYNGEGTVFGSISKADLSKLPILEPPVGLVSAFDRICGPLDERVALCQRETGVLGALRDALLPKLISGELRVGEAERVLAASA